MRRFTVLACLIALGACSPKAEPPAYNTDQDIAELMIHVVDPAAFAFWRGSGTEVTEEGERDLSPTTPEGWKVVEDGASTVAEAGNLLMLPARVREPAADWNRHARDMTARALEAKDAAMRMDKQAAFDTGAKLYQTCVACHAQFDVAAGAEEAPLPEP
ncbi:hypothetical protein [Phenylobacterium sp. J367]|uniref:hypothetical protein n=1 Tax=Phenylobacterium sp. J367 TaxID=2898435 RepID=UPI002151D42B|nr:hypothetical protein [Phenylobacterium sp. J367]MCR5881164.1 hypothetical protein [Phenylobacterium sp. J367]